jgi:hypothetical protein
MVVLLANGPGNYFGRKWLRETTGFPAGATSPAGLTSCPKKFNFLNNA